MSEPAPAPSRPDRRRARTRAALLEVAIQLFQEQGIRATKLEDICARADVAPRTFFNHFETREHLYQAIARQRADQLAAVIAGQAGRAAPLDARLRSLFSSIGAYLCERPAYRELVSEMLSLRLESGNAVVRAGPIGGAARRFVETGVARGEIASRHGPEVLADLMIGAITTAVANWCAGDDYDLTVGLGQAADALLDLFHLP